VADLTLIEKATVKLAFNVLRSFTRAPAFALTRWRGTQQRMAARVIDMLYRTACLAAWAWAVFILVFAATLPVPDWTVATPVAATGAALIWAIGRITQYVFSRH
jgi:hypothetical protein